MHIHLARKLVYLAHPRTASFATVAALEQVGFVQVSPEHHLTLTSPTNPLRHEPRAAWTVITTVRNHWDAAISFAAYFQAKYGLPVDFSLSSLKQRLACATLVQPHSMWELHPDRDVVWRFETLQRDFDDFCAAQGFPQTTIPVINASHTRPMQGYRQLYSAEARDYVGERFAGEIAKLGYEF